LARPSSFRSPCPSSHITKRSAPRQDVGEGLLVELGQVLGALAVLDHQLEGGAHAGARRGLRLLARVHEGEGQVGLGLLPGPQGFLDAAVHVVALRVARQGIRGDYDRTFHPGKQLQGGRRKRVAVAAREIKLVAEFTGQVREQRSQQDQEQHEHSMMQQELETAPAGQLHRHHLRRCASSWRIASARKTAISSKEQAVA
jgi:hypothetical protein